MFTWKKLKHTKTMPFYANITAVTITLGGNKTLPSWFRFAATTLTVTEAHPQWSM